MKGIKLEKNNRNLLLADDMIVIIENLWNFKY